MQLKSGYDESLRFFILMAFSFALILSLDE
jgi:hypothetical protein